MEGKGPSKPEVKDIVNEDNSLDDFIHVDSFDEDKAVASLKNTGKKPDTKPAVAKTEAPASKKSNDKTTKKKPKKEKEKSLIQQQLEKEQLPEPPVDEEPLPTIEELSDWSSSLTYHQSSQKDCNIYGSHHQQKSKEKSLV